MTWPCRAIGSEFDCWYRDREFDPGPILSWRLIMKYFLSSFSFFQGFKKGYCQLQAKACAQRTA